MSSTLPLKNRLSLTPIKWRRTAGSMVYSHSMGTGPGMEQGLEMELMGLIFLCRNILTRPRQGLRL